MVLSRKLNVLGALLSVIPLLTYGFVLNSLWGYITIDNKRLTILSARTVLFFPIYTGILLISLLAPAANDLLEVIIAIAEGFSFFCFLALVIENLGGVRSAIEMQQTNGEQLMCNCANSNYKKFYITMHSRLSNVLTIRPIIVLFQAVFMMIGERNNKRIFKALSGIFALISFIILIFGFVSLMIFFHNVYKQCENMKGVLKIFLLKISVGAIVIQGLIELALSELGKESAQEDDWTQGEYKFLRVYLLLVLAEYLLLSPLVYYGYGSKISSPSRLGNNDNDNNNKRQIPYDRPQITFTEFLSEIFNFPDTFKSLAYDNEALLPPLSANRLD